MIFSKSHYHHIMITYQQLRLLNRLLTLLTNILFNPLPFLIVKLFDLLEPPDNREYVLDVQYYRCGRTHYDSEVQPQKLGACSMTERIARVPFVFELHMDQAPLLKVETLGNVPDVAVLLGHCLIWNDLLYLVLDLPTPSILNKILKVKF